MHSEKAHLGGGSGGDTGMTQGPPGHPEKGGHQLKSAKGVYQIGGNQVALVSRKNLPLPGNPQLASRVTILAGGGAPLFADEGEVDIRGCKGVRITAGPPAIDFISPTVDGTHSQGVEQMVDAPIGSTTESTNGVEIVVSALQNINIQRGVSGLPRTNQLIELSPNNIVIDAGQFGSLTLRAGDSAITFDETGITIVGMPKVFINPGPPPPPPDPEETIC